MEHLKSDDIEKSISTSFDLIPEIGKSGKTDIPRDILEKMSPLNQESIGWGHFNIVVTEDGEDYFHQRWIKAKIESPRNKNIVAKIVYPEFDKKKEYGRERTYDKILVDEEEKIIAFNYYIVAKHPFLKDKADYDFHSNKFMWRGMSFEEIERAIKIGEFKTKGTYNFEEQGDVTFFSNNPRQAFSYAASFAPWCIHPTYTKPGYIIETKQAGLDIKYNEVGEIALKGSLPLDKVTRILEIRVSFEKPGAIEIRHEGISRYEYRIGGRIGAGQGYLIKQIYPIIDTQEHLR